MVLARAAEVACGLRGRAWCGAYTAAVDVWLDELFDAATGGQHDGVALLAVGGYGRGELCPESDIDVFLVSDRDDVAAIADRLWYPIWDQAIHLGHNVCTVREGLRLAADDLDTATALLTVRHIAGDPRFAPRISEGAAQQWLRRSRRWLAELGARIALRHAKYGEVAFALEPDLKEGRGGLRDAHALGWAEVAHRALLADDQASVADAYGTMLDARVALQLLTGRAANVLALHDQADVASAVGCRDSDELMARVAEAARTIAWTSDDTWRRIRSARRGPLGRVARRDRGIDDQLSLCAGEVHLRDDAAPEPTLILRAAVAAASRHTLIDRRSLERLAAGGAHPAVPWPAEARRAFCDLLLTGRAAVPVIEALDQRGLWALLLPEWSSVRSRPQRNAYHRYTVDRHLLETVAHAARGAGAVDRPDLLVMAALLHDLGKGEVGDHTDAGVVIAARVAERMGFDAADVETLVACVRHHLLLADVATRRDLDDPGTIERVVVAVGSLDRLRLLAALTEADGLATGASAWGPWKAELVQLLVDRVGARLGGVSTDGPAPAMLVSPEQLIPLAAGPEGFDASANVLTVVTADRPGVFSRVAGVLALHGLDVLAAAAYSNEFGRAVARFGVADPLNAEIRWERVIQDLEAAFAGRLALGARVADRARRYRRSRPASIEQGTRVMFDVDASATATVIDVQTADRVGVLYRITRALAELDLDIRSARVQTLGAAVVDAFYVRDVVGAKVTDPRVLQEIELAITHSLEADAPAGIAER